MGRSGGFHALTPSRQGTRDRHGFGLWDAFKVGCEVLLSPTQLRRIRRSAHSGMTRRVGEKVPHTGLGHAQIGADLLDAAGALLSGTNHNGPGSPSRRPRSAYRQPIPHRSASRATNR